MTTTDESKYLFVASTGGHLAQLDRLASSLDWSPESLWVTFRTPQSESLLAGRRVLWVDYVRSRDLIGTVRAAKRLSHVLRRERFDAAVSTGAAVAVAALPLARLRGIPTMYIESVSRVRGPSLTGRIIAALHAAALRTQHPEWARGRWQPHGSVFGTYRVVPRNKAARPRLFVTLGTIQGYEFHALIDAVLATGLADEHTVWQLGSTRRDGLPGLCVDQLDAASFRRQIENADVVITHAGVGTLLDVLDAGAVAVVVPRRQDRREHIDDHQEQIATLVGRLGVAIVAEATDLTEEHIRRAAGLRAVPAEDMP